MIRRAALLSSTALTPQSKGVRNGYILDDWDQIICNVKAGEATKYYATGDWKEIDLGEYGWNVMEIDSIPGDNLDETRTSKANIKWKTRYLLSKKMPSFTAAVWPNSGAKVFFDDTLFNSLPSFLKENLVSTYHIAYDTRENKNNTERTPYPSMVYLLPTSAATLPYKAPSGTTTYLARTMYQDHAPKWAVPSIASNSTDGGGVVMHTWSYLSYKYGSTAKGTQMCFRALDAQASGSNYFYSMGTSAYTAFTCNM